MGLPRVLVQKRVANEVGLCRRNLNHTIKVKGDSFDTFPVTIKVILKNVPGPVFRNGEVGYHYTHKLKIEVDDEYPYKKPLVVWLSDIFHPNIMPPGEGGFVCTKLLDNWSFSSDLLSFIKGLESLLVTPNPENPFDSDTCTKAAEYFNRHRFEPPLVVKEG